MPDKVRFIASDDILQIPVVNGQLIFGSQQLCYDINGSRHDASTPTWEVVSDWDDRGLEYNSWATIQKYIKEGTIGEKAQMGDSKAVTLSTGQTIHMQLASINTGTGTATSYYPANTADFIGAELLNGINFVVSTQGYGYSGESSNCTHTVLNTQVIDTLPEDLQSVIINKQHLYNRTDTNGNWSHNHVSAKLWVPTCYEATGQIGYNGYSPDHSIYGNSGYNEHYELFRTIPSSLQKSRNWGLSSPTKLSTTYPSHMDGYIITSSGQLSYINISSNPPGVPLCFRIG